MVLATAEEAQDESSLDQNKYHRVRVERKMKVCVLQLVEPFGVSNAL